MKKFIFAIFMVSLLATMTFAQSTTGTLLGNVSSPDGLLPGATVTITDNQTGRDLVKVTNDDGSFRFEKLSYGTYTVKVTSPGFKTFIANEVKIDVNREYSLKPVLEVGQLTEQVIVQAGADIINSTDAALSNTVSPRQVLDLPINGRNPLALLNLQAGVNATSNSINGQRSSSVNYTRDGINVQDNFIRTGGFVQDRPTVDNTGEFTVVTQNAGAELGGGGSAQVRLVTPRGGKDFHGAGFIYNRNSEFAANEFGNNATGTERPFLNRNQFGGKFSGPLPFPGFGQGTPVLIKDKANFFLSYERFLLRQTSPQTRNVLLARDGTFTYQATDGTIRTVNVLSGTGLTGAIPASSGGVLGLDPTIQTRFLSLTPTAGNGIITNATRTTSGTIVQPLVQQFLFNQANNDTRNNFASRIDFDFNDRNSLYFSYGFNNNADDRTDADGGFQQQPFVVQGGPTQFYLLSYTTVIGSNLTNEIRGAYAQSDPFFNESPNFPTNFRIGGLPFGLSSPESTFQAQGRSTDQYTFQDNASYTVGNHSLRFGIDFNAQRIASQTNFSRVPVFSITGTGNTQTPGLSAGLFPGGISAADRARADALRFLLGGIVGSGSVQANFVNPATGQVIGASDINRFEYETTGLYFTDQWRATSNLTLNLGLRYDYFAPLRNPDQAYLEPDLSGASGFDQIRSALLNPNGQYVLLGNNAGVPGTFFKGDKNNFGPIIGIAYTPEFGGILGSLFGKEKQTVLRGGFRVGYINDEYVRSADNAAGGNQGLDRTVNIINPATGTSQINARFNNLPTFNLPPFNAPPISFQTGTLNAGNFFNTVFAVSPNLEVQQNMEYSFGIQREIGFDTAIELRYVGGRSNSLVRGFDFNQVDIRAGGFLRDFLIARENCRILAASQGQTLGENGCRTAAGQLNATGTQGLPGQIPLTTLGNLPFGAFLTNGAIVPSIVAGNAADLAITYIVNGLDLERDANGNLTGNGINFRPNPNAGPVDLLDNAGRYRYNALQFEIRRRFTDGLSFQANYTFQKTLADVLSDGQARFDPFLDINNQELEYSRTDYDRTHTVNINANYELPFGRGKRFFNQGGLTNAILGGFQVTSIINISSGPPLSIKDINGTLNRVGRSNRQTANSNLTTNEIKDLIGIFKQNGKIYLIDPSVLCSNGSAIQNNVFTTANSTCPNQVFFRAQPGQTGNLPRGFINGPMYFNWNAGLIKNIAFNERFRIQLRADAFNVLNNVNFFVGENSGIFDIDSTSFGEISPSSTYDPRILQFALRIEF